MRLATTALVALFFAASPARAQTLRPWADRCPPTDPLARACWGVGRSAVGPVAGVVLPGHPPLTLEGGPLTREVEFQEWVEEDWVRRHRVVYSRDGEGRLDTLLTQLWGPDGWADGARTVYTYDAAGNATEQRSQSWVGDAWVDGGLMLVTYNGRGLPVRYLYHLWEGGEWAVFSRTTNEYDGEDRLAATLYQSRAEDGGWWNDELVSYVWAADGALAEVRRQGWDGGAWYYTSRTLYAYDGEGHVTEEVVQLWDGDWWDDSRSLVAYDEGWRPVEVLVQYWTGEAWEDGSRVASTYTDAGALAEAVVQHWREGAWENASRRLYEYEQPVGAEGGPGALALSVAPSPMGASGGRVRFSLREAAVVRLSLVDVLGREVRVLADGAAAAGPSEVALDAGALAPGVYVVRLTVGPARASRLVTVAR